MLAELETPERGVRRTACRCTRPTSDHGECGTAQLEMVCSSGNNEPVTSLDARLTLDDHDLVLNDGDSDRAVVHDSGGMDN